MKPKPVQKRRNSAIMIWATGLLLVVIVLVVQGLRNAGFEFTTQRVIVGVAFLLLILLQILRLSKGAVRRAAEPDPKSTLKLS